MKNIADKIQKFQNSIVTIVVFLALLVIGVIIVPGGYRQANANQGDVDIIQLTGTAQNKTPILLSGTSNGGNSLVGFFSGTIGNNGIFGTGTLTSGTANVANAGVVTGATVLLTPSGTMAGNPNLSYTVQSGTGFTVTSGSGTDVRPFSYLVLP